MVIGYPWLRAVSDVRCGWCGPSAGGLLLSRPRRTAGSTAASPGGTGAVPGLPVRLGVLRLPETQERCALPPDLQAEAAEAGAVRCRVRYGVNVVHLRVVWRAQRRAAPSAAPSVRRDGTVPTVRQAAVRAGAGAVPAVSRPVGGRGEVATVAGEAGRGLRIRPML